MTLLLKLIREWNQYFTIIELQNGLSWKRTLKAPESSPCNEQGHIQWIRLLRALSNLTLNIEDLFIQILTLLHMLVEECSPTCGILHF